MCQLDKLNEYELEGSENCLAEVPLLVCSLVVLGDERDRMWARDYTE
jgi:hypothetical protein